MPATLLAAALTAAAALTPTPAPELIPELIVQNWAGALLDLSVDCADGSTLVLHTGREQVADQVDPSVLRVLRVYSLGGCSPTTMVHWDGFHYGVAADASGCPAIVDYRKATPAAVDSVRLACVTPQPQPEPQPEPPTTVPPTTTQPPAVPQAPTPEPQPQPETPPTAVASDVVVTVTQLPPALTITPTASRGTLPATGAGPLTGPLAVVAVLLAAVGAAAVTLARRITRRRAAELIDL